MRFSSLMFYGVLDVTAVYTAVDLVCASFEFFTFVDNIKSK